LLARFINRVQRTSNGVLNPFIKMPLVYAAKVIRKLYVFSQVVNVHQNTVDTYLEDVILGAIDSTAHEQVKNLVIFIETVLCSNGKTKSNASCLTAFNKLFVFLF
jgi:hypothetical protein